MTAKEVEVLLNEYEGDLNDLVDADNELYQACTELVYYDMCRSLEDAIYYAMCFSPHTSYKDFPTALDLLKKQSK